MPRPAPIDPAADAAALLRRIGFATLMVALPVVALVARRGVVVLVPIGIALLILAAALDGSHQNLRDTARRLASAPAGLASGLVLAWCALSLFWTPFFAPASERLLNIMATVAIALAGYFALPERMRSANLYLVPIGAALAAITAAALALSGSSGAVFDEEGQSLERGLVVLVLLLWPSVAWLRSRQRHVEALVLAVMVALAAVLAPRPMPLIALAAGALVYAATAYAPTFGVRATAIAMAGLLALAPLIPFIARPVAAELFGRGHPYVASLRVWRRVITDEPIRLITGHGFETALRGRFVGLLPAEAPNTLLFEVWYELGIVGALAGAAGLYFATMAAGRQQPALASGAIAAFATAFSFACLGIGTAQMWWFTALAVVALIFVAAERGQFRTTRPKASFVRPAHDR